MGDTKSSFWDDWVTPDLARNPGLASDVYNSGQPKVVAPIVSYATRGIAVQDAISDHSQDNGTDKFWNKLGNTALAPLEWLGKGLKEIQRDYKFTHSVYVDHGFLPGFAVTLGVIGGGVGGAFLGGPIGAIAGIDAAGVALRKLSTVGPWKNTYSDSYAKSNNDNYTVSAGRDFSNALAVASDALGADGTAKAFRNTSTGKGKTASGFVDLAFDINTDPTMIVGRFGQLMKFGKFLGLDKAGAIQLKYPILDTVPGVRDFIISRSRLAVTSDQIDMVRAGSGIFNSSARVYNRALDDIAKSTAGEIVQKFPQLGTIAAGRLGAMKSADEVHQFFKTSLYFGELQGTLAGQAMLPTRTLLRAKFGDSKVVDILRNASIPKFIGTTAAGVRILNPEWKKLGVKKSLGNVYKTFSGYMPYSVDAETAKLSLTKFRWNAPDAATTVYRMGRIGLGDSAAKEIAGKYAEAVAVNDLGLARSIKNHTILESFKALGLPDDNVFVKNVMDEINQISEPLVGTQIYGTNVLGENIGEYITAQGPKVGGIVSGHARDMFDIPDYYEIKKAMRAAGKFAKYVGPIDEFIAKRYTNKIFKPLALATMGFGLRIAASELIPTFARFGVINTFKSKLTVAVAKSDYDLMPQETSHIFAAAMTALGLHNGITPDVMQAGFPAFQEAKRRGLKFAAKMLPDDQIELATKIVLANKGMFLSEAVQTGHGYDAATSYQMNQAAHYYYQIQKNSPMFRDLPEYTTYSASDIHYAPRYATNLNKAANETTYKNIATDLTDLSKKYTTINKFQIDDDITKMAKHKDFLALRKELVDKEYDRMLQATNGTYSGYNKEIRTLTRWEDAVANGELRTFAQDRVDSLLGMVVGKDGTYLESFAKNIAAGESTDFDQVVTMVRDFKKSVPAAVAGPALQPYVPGKGLIEKITNIGFKKVIDPIVNGLAREPLYMIHVADAYARLAPQVIAKKMLDSQAVRIAQTQASYAMLPQIHNTALRNQFSQLARNFLPFYFAQEQALKRAYATLKDTSIASPLFSRGLRFYQLAEHALNDPGFVQADENGNKYIYLPGVGEFGKAVQSALAAYNIPIVSGLPITARGSLVSLKSVLPELQTPGVSPIFAVTANLISDWFPSTKEIVNKTVGDISFQRGVIDSLIPATWAKTALAAFTPIDLSNQMGNAMASALAAAYYHGQVPGPDSNEYDRQNFINRIQNNARSILAVKTFLNLTSPLAPQISQEDSGFRDEFWKLVKSKGNYADALLEFLGTHGNKAISYTVAKTTSNVPGAKYPYIQETVDYINNNKEMFNSKSGVSTGAFYLIPQDNAKNESDRAVYNEIMNMHLRSYLAPKDLLKQFYISQGDQFISPEIKKHIAIIDQASANYDSYSKQVENDRWSQIMTKMKNLYPIWYVDYTSNEGRVNAQTAYNQLTKIFSSSNPPQHEQAKLVKALMGDYQRHSEIMSQYNMLNIQGIASTEEKQKWENYLLSLSESEPKLKPVIKSIFMKLG